LIGEKCFELLKTFHLSELKNLTKAVQSPIFGGNESLMKLYEYLRKYYPAFTHKKLKGEYVYALLYPNKEYKEGVLRVKYRQLTKVIENFLIWTQINNDEFQRKKILKDAFGARNNFDLFKKENDKLKTTLESSPFRDMEYYQEKVLLDYAFAFHPLRNRYKERDSSLEDLLKGIESFTLLCKFRVGVALKNDEKIFNRTFDLPFIAEITAGAYTDFQVENPLVDLYANLFALMENQEVAMFFKLKSLFLENVSSIRGADQLIIFYLCLNYCVRNATRGEVRFYKEALELYKIGLKLKIVFVNGVMSDITFSNIVNIACHEEEYDWVDQFIETQKQYLNFHLREDAICFSKSILDFNLKKYDQAVALISSHHFSKDYQPKVRFLSVRILFEQFLNDSSLFDVLQAQIDAYEKFIQRDEFFTVGKLKPHLNTIKLLKGLSLKITNLKSKALIKEWYSEKLERTSLLIDKNWLQKINDLI